MEAAEEVSQNIEFPTPREHASAVCSLLLGWSYASDSPLSVPFVYLAHSSKYCCTPMSEPHHLESLSVGGRSQPLMENESVTFEGEFQSSRAKQCATVSTFASTRSVNI